MTEQTCILSGKKFEVSSQEIALRKKLGGEGFPTIAPELRFRHLGAFWQHWHLYSRQCDRTGKNIISVFSEKCPYPVWHKDEWFAHADPPSAEFDETREVFPQMWEVFQQSPIPHNIGTGCQNCEYTDDWWYSKNCYLCHSGVECEDLSYCYRTLRVKDCQFCVFSFDSEFCTDLVNCRYCFEVIYAFDCRSCHNSAFLYDCRNCNHCLFCFNLRNKSYCIGNKQLTKEEYEKEREKWDFASREVFEQSKVHFVHMMEKLAVHRALHVDKCQDSTGNFLENCKNVQNCFCLANFEDCIHCLRGDYAAKNCLEALGVFRSELLFSTSQVQDTCYDCKYSYNLTHCRFMEYCAHCVQCKNCFACCGLRGEEFRIFNKKYSEEEYFAFKDKIIQKMRQTSEYGQFFPGYFAAHPYDESLSAFYFPLSREEQQKLGFRLQEGIERIKGEELSVAKIPDSSQEEPRNILGKVFWDKESKKPFQISEKDIAFCKKLGAPFPNQYYMNRIQDNFSWMPFNGELRDIVCGKCGSQTKTAWPEKFDTRILCEKCYLGVVQ